MIYGPKDIFGFNAAMLVGCIVGTYSSMFIALAIFLKLESRNIGKAPKAKKVYEDSIKEKMIKGINC